MYELKITFATADDLQDAVNKLNGITTVGVSLDDDKPAKPKKETPSKKAEAVTKSAFEETDGKKAGKGKKKTVPSVDELKAHILAHAGDGADQPEKVKEYVRSFGVAKISDMTEAQRQEAFDGAEAHFADGEEGEEDPMA